MATDGERSPRSTRLRETVSVAGVVFWAVGPPLVLWGMLIASSFMGVEPEPSEKARGTVLAVIGVVLAVVGPLLAEVLTRNPLVRLIARLELVVVAALALAAAIA